MRRKLLAAAMGMLCAAAVFSGCGGGQQAQSAKADKHLNVGLYWLGETADPAHAWDGWTITRIGAGETLVTVTDKMEFAGQLADKWENVSPTTWKFHIREKVKFQNGDDMTPEMVKASLERTLKESERSQKSSKIKEIKVDGQNLIIETSEPNAALLATITEPAFCIIDTKADLSKAESTPVLTGPYQITKYTKNEEIDLKKNDNYWGGKTGLDSLTVKFIKDDGKRAMSLQSGELDMIQRMDTASRSLFANDKYDIHETVGTRVYMMDMNVEGVLKDPHLRQAVASAINYNAIAEVEGNGALPAGAPFPPSIPYAQTKNKQAFDANKVKTELAAAGYTEKNAEGIYVKDGKPLSLSMAVWGNKSQMYEAIQAQLKESGIDAKIVRIQEPDISKVEAHDLTETNWITAGTNDTYWFLDQVYRTGSRSNYGRYSNPEVDALLDKMYASFDTKDRQALAKEIAEKVVSDNVAIWLDYPANNIVTTKKVKNVPVFPIDYYVITKDITI
ncbi:ABC transporter substrate-binding protein [Dialister sp.]|uniref:ABC transporter substrate-binding protein n=1 Tax=Dialister sp. TaxID=1955814 RepID=UPI002E7FE6A5|nr:ABC transporter substrate-binding protein [Dialister sp.]MEE3453589.1 ABC transporter substrate-binding protein [Dialister sp.]